MEFCQLVDFLLDIVSLVSLVCLSFLLFLFSLFFYFSFASYLSLFSLFLIPFLSPFPCLQILSSFLPLFFPFFLFWSCVNSSYCPSSSCLISFLSPFISVPILNFTSAAFTNCFLYILIFMVYFLSSPTVLVLHPGSCFILFSLSQPHGSYVSFFDPVCSLQITFITINISAIIQSKVFPTVFLDPLMRYYDLHLAVCVCVCVYVHVMSLHRNICPVFCSSAKCLPFLELCRISNLKSLEITYFFMCLGLY